MLSIINSFIALILILGISVPSVSAAIVPPVIPVLLLSEVKVNHDTTQPEDIDEFIELYNPTSETVDLSQYELWYFNTLDILTQVPTKKITPISASLLGPGSHLVLAEDTAHTSIAATAVVQDLSTSGLKNDTGRIHVVEKATGAVIDSTAWGSIAAVVQTYIQSINRPAVEVCASCATGKTTSLSRYMASLLQYDVLSNVWRTDTPSPGTFGIYVPPVDEEVAPDDQPEEQPPVDEETVPDETLVGCEGVVISELLPNPAGSDTESEFIELYNASTASVALDNCQLQTSGSSKLHGLSGDISPGGYIVVSAPDSGLILPNSAGGTVWLLSNDTEINMVEYPSNLGDDVSWSLIEGLWQQSFVPTKAATNIAAPEKPCADGLIRDEVSRQCKTIPVITLAATSACRPGQERNPDTNRCRSVTSTAVGSVLTSCKEGQERNPATNRCRAITQATTLEPCDEGWERNPETNRCRKITSSGSTLGSVTDVPAKSIQNSSKWWILGVVLVLVVGYALYEWRTDAAQLAGTIRSRVWPGRRP